MIDISKLSKAEVLRRLYNRSGPQGMGIVHYKPEPMTLEQAQVIVDKVPSLYFDYVQGRVMKVDLSGDQLNPRLYDRDNGEGAAAAALDETD